MSRARDAAARIAAAYQQGTDGRDRAIAAEMDMLRADFPDWTDGYWMTQAELWLGALRVVLNDMGVPWTVAEEEDFFVSMFGDAASACLNTRHAEAAAWAAELAAAGITIDDALAASTEMLRQEAAAREN